MNSDKLIGYVLLAMGLALIGFAVCQSYVIFTGKSPASLVFKNEAKLQPIKGSEGVAVQDFQKQLQDQVRTQISQMIPTDAVVTVLNLLVWTMLAGTFIFGGGQLAGIGIKLIKG